MSTTTKVVIGVVALAIVGGIVYAATRPPERSVTPDLGGGSAGGGSDAGVVAGFGALTAGIGAARDISVAAIQQQGRRPVASGSNSTGTISNETQH